MMLCPAACAPPSLTAGLTGARITFLADTLYGDQTPDGASAGSGTSRADRTGACTPGWTPGISAHYFPCLPPSPLGLCPHGFFAGPRLSPRPLGPLPCAEPPRSLRPGPPLRPAPPPALPRGLFPPPALPLLIYRLACCSASVPARGCGGSGYFRRYFRC